MHVKAAFTAKIHGVEYHVAQGARLNPIPARAGNGATLGYFVAEAGKVSVKVGDEVKTLDGAGMGFFKHDFVHYGVICAPENAER